MAVVEKNWGGKGERRDKALGPGDGQGHFFLLPAFMTKTVKHHSKRNTQSLAIPMKLHKLSKSRAHVSSAGWTEKAVGDFQSFHLDPS